MIEELKGENLEENWGRGRELLFLIIFNSISNMKEVLGVLNNHHTLGQLTIISILHTTMYSLETARAQELWNLRLLTVAAQNMWLGSLGVCRDFHQILETFNRCQRELAALLLLFTWHNTSTTRGRSMHCEHTIHNQRHFIIFQSLFTAICPAKVWQVPSAANESINFRTKCILRTTGGLPSYRWRKRYCWSCWRRMFPRMRLNCCCQSLSHPTMNNDTLRCLGMRTCDKIYEKREDDLCFEFLLELLLLLEAFELGDGVGGRNKEWSLSEIPLLPPPAPPALSLVDTVVFHPRSLLFAAARNWFSWRVSKTATVSKPFLSGRLNILQLLSNHLCVCVQSGK